MGTGGDALTSAFLRASHLSSASAKLGARSVVVATDRGLGMMAQAMGNRSEETKRRADDW
jgi:hypothetical protein